MRIEAALTGDGIVTLRTMLTRVSAEADYVPRFMLGEPHHEVSLNASLQVSAG